MEGERILNTLFGGLGVLDRHATASAWLWPDPALAAAIGRRVEFAAVTHRYEPWGVPGRKSSVAPSVHITP